MSRDITSGGNANHKDNSSRSSGSDSGVGYSFGFGSGYSTGCGDAGNYGFDRVFETQEYGYDGYGRGRSCGAGSKYYIGIGRTL